MTSSGLWNVIRIREIWRLISVSVIALIFADVWAMGATWSLPVGLPQGSRMVVSLAIAQKCGMAHVRSCSSFESTMLSARPTELRRSMEKSCSGFVLCPTRDSPARTVA